MLRHFTRLNSIRAAALLFLLALLLLGSAAPLYAQTRYNTDSATQARKAQLEASRAAQKHQLDSARASRQHILDSTRTVRARITDSLKEIREYRQSRAYRDSVQSAREERVATIREASRARLDSMKSAREHATDSAIAARESATALLRKGQQRRADSLAAIRAYKTSKRASDSVAIVKKSRADSLHSARKAFTDSLASARQLNLNQLKAARKAVTDSLAAARKVRSDSLAAVRKARAADLAKKKDNQQKDKKLEDKKKEDKTNIAIAIKIKQKRSKFSNENMLKKKWSAPRRAVQNTFTHYNYYFNARRKMEEAELNMQRSVKDKWDERISLLPFDPLRDSTLFSSDMDSVIQKASIGIQIHDPRTKWGDDLYLLLGQAYYYKGDKDNAEASFRYIVALQEKLKADAAKRGALSNKAVRGNHKETPSVLAEEKKGALAFLAHQPATNDALLWLARTYSSFGAYSQAESILDLLGSDAKFPESLRGRLALEQSLLALRQHDDKEASQKLAIVSGDKNIDAYVRRRAAYLAGQILQAGGSYEAAAKQYALVTDLHPKIDMDFYARRNRAYSLMQAGGVQSDAIASLKSMLGDGKFAPYFDQVYYVLGRLSANSGRNAEAISYLQRGIAAPKATKKGKAMSFAAMGNIYFNTGEYTAAKTAFDSVARYGSYAAEDSGVILATRRSLVVDKVAGPAGVIRRQDSLLALGAASEKEQRATVRRYLRALQAQRSDSSFRAENGGIAAAQVVDNNASPEAAAMSWYFANPTMMQQGIVEFKRKWGTRPQVDNWRRSSAIAGSTNSSGAPITAGTDGDNSRDADASATDDNGLPTEEALLAYIPTNSESRAVAIGRLQRAYVDVATAYIRAFEDYKRATITLDTFEQRWPANPYSAEATYLRYLIALGTNNLKDAQARSAKLQSDFAGTEWAALVAPPSTDNSDENGPLTASVGEYYDATYDLLQQRQYGEVLSRSRAARRQFPTNEAYLSRFRIMEAMAYAGSEQWGEADTILSVFIRTHAGDPLQSWAEQVQRYVAAHKAIEPLTKSAPPAAPSADSAGAGKATSIGPAADSSGGPVPAEYAYHPQEVHYFIFAANKMEPKVMGVRAGLGDLNTFKYPDQNLQVSVEAMNASKAMVVVKQFRNAAAAKAYVAAFRYAPQLVREFQPNEYQTLIISRSNYRKLMADRGLGSYLPFYRAHY